jgi:hypothetical protein
VHGRDRLLQAFERARLVAVDVTAELSPLGEPDEYVDLSPTTGPVPIMVPSTRIGEATSVDDFVPRTPDGPSSADVSSIEPADADDDPTGAAVDADDGPAADLDAMEHVEQVDGVERVEDEPAADAGEEPVAADDPTDDADHADDAVQATVFPFPVQAAPEANPVTDTDTDTDSEIDAAAGAPDDETDDDVDDDIDDDDVTATDVDALFAKLRANPPTETDPELDAGDDATADVAETPFRARDAELVPLIVAAARKLKRVLADEQNDVLDALRRKEPVRDVDTLVPLLAEQTARYADAITAELIAAVEAGAVSAGGTGDLDIGPDGPLRAVRDHVAEELVGPLRERLERCVVEGDGVNDAVTKRIRGVYREWKTQRIDEQLDDTFRLAYCQGALVALGAGTAVTWEVDPDGPPSPDCEDNGLAGPVASGEAFPSGHVSPPMHPGCRCLLLRADR